MPDSVVQSWLSAEEIYLVWTEVSGDLNIISIVTRRRDHFQSYDLKEHELEFVGPVQFVENPLSSDQVHSALKVERNYTVIRRVSEVTVERIYFMANGVSISTINCISIVDENGMRTVLERSGAAYPYSLVLQQPKNDY